MFHKMISAARDKWYESSTCTVKNIIDYIIKTDMLRDAQVEAIKTYLYLKIGCNNKTLASLFQSGAFNTLNLADIDLTLAARTELENNPAAAALLEYSLLKNDSGQQVSKKLEMAIKQAPESIDYAAFFADAFYGVTYTDYLFSLPMGAGKTFLMMAFIYLDLYFALNEPENPSFAHNFIVFVPSGLKSSVIPSLRTMALFCPAWVLPEPSASAVKKIISFEVLDQPKAAKKSTKSKNPNVQKIARHQPLDALFGLVAVTNAEKVILDRIEEDDGQINMYEDSEDEKDRLANELRNQLGKIPSLAIFIDEVHHAVNSEIKLRAVISKWAENGSINSVMGFSGTPYLEKSEKIKVHSTLSVTCTEISNTVYYYPLLAGIGNFLKRPVVKISNTPDSTLIVEDGVRLFLGTFKDTVYEGGLTAKLGIYCGSIEKLEQIIYPLVRKIVQEYGLPPEAILKFHRGNRQYPAPVESQLQFDTLDKAISKIRIVLLVQIGKEGWDCRSLTGIILSQEGDCPKNMVLQTSCRCLRQVVKNMPEDALIYLNESNADKLTAQLQKQHHISLKEFSAGSAHTKTEIKRYDRTDYLKLPPVHFYQLKISYDEIIIKTANPSAAISDIAVNTSAVYSVKTQDLAGNITGISVDTSERGNIFASFTSWLYHIAKSGFGFISIERLKEHSGILNKVFGEITYEKNGVRYFSSKYNRLLVEENIRKAFYDKRTFNTKEELIPEEAQLLNISNFTSAVSTDSPSDYFPDQVTVENIMLDDAGKLKIPQTALNLIKAAEEGGYTEIAEVERQKYAAHHAKNRSFHYLPYKSASGFERETFEEILALDDIKRLGLEVYYNGDRSLTEFRIRCYKRVHGKWNYIGMYTPDFLIIQRENGKIYKAVIVETKGEGFAADFSDRREFMKEHFTRFNNEEYGYERFDYLELEEILSFNELAARVHSKICAFFQE